MLTSIRLCLYEPQIHTHYSNSLYLRSNTQWNFIICDASGFSTPATHELYGIIRNVFCCFVFFSVGFEFCISWHWNWIHTFPRSNAIELLSHKSVSNTSVGWQYKSGIYRLNIHLSIISRNKHDEVKENRGFCKICLLLHPFVWLSLSLFPLLTLPFTPTPRAKSLTVSCHVVSCDVNVRLLCVIKIFHLTSKEISFYGCKVLNEN